MAKLSKIEEKAWRQRGFFPARKGQDTSELLEKAVAAGAAAEKAFRGGVRAGERARRGES